MMLKKCFTAFFLTGIGVFSTLNSFATFWENKGQWPEDVLFHSASGAGGMWICADKIVFQIIHPDDRGHWAMSTHYPDSIITTRSHVFSIRWEDTSWQGRVTKESETPHYCNFFLGSDPKNWASHVKGFEVVTLHDIWPGIDIVISPGKNWVKYDYVVHPGADASAIRWAYTGVGKAVLREGRIDLETSVGVFSEVIPDAWEEDFHGLINQVSVSYCQDNESFGFEKFEHNHEHKLVIDPELIVATYVGAYGWATDGFNFFPPTIGSLPYSAAAGSGSTSSVQGEPIGYGGIGTLGFPVTVGAFMTEKLGFGVSGIVKFNTDASALSWCTFLGPTDFIGSQIVDTYDINVGPDGNLYIASTTTLFSSDCGGCFPVTLPPLQPVETCSSYFYLSVLSASGSSLVSSRLIGCTADPFTDASGVMNQSGRIAEISFAGNGDPIVVCTVNSGDFPITSGAYDTTFSGTLNAAIFRISPNLESLVWSTFFGGSNANGQGRTWGLSLTVLNNDIVAIGGRCTSVAAVTTLGAYMATAPGSNGFIAILSADGTSLQYGTLVSFPEQGETSAPSTELIRFIDTDNEGNLWAVGMSQNNSSNIQCTSESFCEPEAANFIVKFSPSLDQLLISSRIGSPVGIPINPTAFMVDNCGYVYFSGNTGAFASSDGTVFPPDFGPIALTPDAIATQGGFYLAVFEPDMAGLHYGTLFGGNHTDAGRSRFDKKGVVYQTVCVPSWVETYFEATPNAWSTEIGPNLSVEMGMFKIDFQSPATTAIMTAEVLPSEGCYPVQVQTNNYSTAGQYTWLANGTEVVPDSAGVIELYAGGTVELMLAVYNAESCNMADTAKVTLQIPLYPTLEAAWTVDEADPCAQGGTAVSAQWTGQNATSLTWESWAGTGTGEDFAAAVTEPGSYALTLTATDSICGASEFFIYAFDYMPFTFGATGAASDSCALPVVFAGQFTGAGTDQVLWQWGAESVEGVDFEQSFAEQGIYTVSVTATNEQCNQTESESWTFTAWGTMEASVVPPAETVYCVGESVALSGQTNTGTAQWTTPEGTVNSPTFNFQPSTQGSFDLTFTASDPAACNGFFEQTVTLTFVEPPEAAFTLLSESVPCEDNAEVQLTFTGNNAAELLWDMGDGAAYSDSAFVHTYTESGNYTIELTAFNPPCQPATVSEDVQIWVEASSASETEFREVNIITPNGDGVNDCLRFFPSSTLAPDFKSYDLKVFNRWGTLVFSSSSFEDAWCGEGAEAGTYYYLLRYALVCGEAGDLELAGAVTVGR